ncbi:hypothetical protein EV401DRAFT_2074771 [Pisolithus croceorrhizus]|nr:hypothetical protein EV401DRAFT_2074771 [Pisolithus croceorrhizus]
MAVRILRHLTTGEALPVLLKWLASLVFTPRVNAEHSAVTGKKVIVVEGMHVGSVMPMMFDPINSTMVPKETAETMGRVIQGAIVTYGAGLNIIGVTTGFESCTLHVKNISADTKEDDLCALISQQGVDPVRFHLVGMRRAGGEKVEAEIMTDEQLGWDLLAVLKDNGLEVEILTHNTLEGMAASSVQDATVLTLSWPSPAARYAVTYIDVAAARAKVRQLNGCTYNHRRVKAQMNNETSSRARIPLGPDTIIISNLSPEIDDAEMVIFSGSSSVKRLESTLSLSTHEVEGHLRDVISRIAPGCVQSLGSSSIPDPNGFVSIRARFRSRDDALTVQQFLKTSEYGKDVGMWFRVPHPLDFTLSLDIEQYVAQKNQWDALMGSLKDPEACVLNIHEEGHTVRVRLSGSQKDALGALKVQVEDLARGETVQGWHRALEHPKNEFSKQVLDETGAYMRVDRKNRAITVFGSAASISRAREMISEELDRLSSADFSAIVPKPAVRSLINHGLAQLKETFGEDTIKFDMTSRRITISGGEEARHALDSIIRSAMRSSGKPSVASQSETACPICGGDISVPFHLGCGHVYCVACLRYFLLSALNAPDFPLRCLGNDGRCGVPIPIPTIHRFLPPASFNRLLEAAFTTYLVKHANEFKYCKTPDCTQIYRSTSSEAPEPSGSKTEGAAIGACGHPRTTSGYRGGATAEEEETFETISRQVQGSIVTYTAGLDVLSLTTGFESCTFLIDNIPEDANGAEMLALFAQGGLKVDQFYLIGIQTAGAGKLNAVIVADAKAGETLFTSSVDLRYRNDVLGVDMTAPCYLHGAGKSSVCDATALTVAWRAHRRDFVPQYFDETTMLAKVRDSISNDFGHTSHAETTGDAEQELPVRMNVEHPVAIGSRETVRKSLIAGFRTYTAILRLPTVGVYPPALSYAKLRHPTAEGQSAMVPMEYKFKRILLMALLRRVTRLSGLVGEIVFATFGKRIIAHKGIIVGIFTPMMSIPTDPKAVQKEAAETIGRVVQGSIVTYGAGLDIVDLTTGFEACTLRVKNVPSDTEGDAVRAMMTRRGVNTSRFCIVGIKSVGGDKVEAEIMTDEQLGWDLLAIFKQNGLEVEVSAPNTSEGMVASSVQDATILTLSWPSPAAQYAVRYISADVARTKVHQLDGYIHNDRRIKARMNEEFSSRTRTPLGPYMSEIW